MPREPSAWYTDPTDRCDLAGSQMAVFPAAQFCDPVVSSNHRPGTGSLWHPPTHLDCVRHRSRELRRISAAGPSDTLLGGQL